MGQTVFRQRPMEIRPRRVGATPDSAQGTGWIPGYPVLKARGGLVAGGALRYLTRIEDGLSVGCGVGNPQQTAFISLLARPTHDDGTVGSVFDDARPGGVLPALGGFEFAAGFVDDVLPSI